VGKSGLSEKMQVGTIAKLALDDSVAMRIKFEAEPPAQRDMYLRGPVLSSFDGREWRPARPDFRSRFSVAASLVVTGTPTNYVVTLEQTNRPWLFVLDAAPNSPEIAGYQSTMQADLQWLLNKPVTELIRYKAQSYTSFRHGPEKPVIGLREFVELPAGFNPRTLALANEIRRDARYAQAGSAELVQVVLERLRTGGYTYTLEPGLYGPNTADDFWFDIRRAYRRCTFSSCTAFATVWMHSYLAIRSPLYETCFVQTVGYVAACVGVRRHLADELAHRLRPAGHWRRCCRRVFDGHRPPNLGRAT
jgi:hypothetical protein